MPSLTTKTPWVEPSSLPGTGENGLTRRGLWCLGLWALSLLVFRSPLAALVQLASQDERYTYILIVPVVSAFLVWLEKDRIFRSCRYAAWTGVPILVTGLLLGVLVERFSAPGDIAGLSGAMFSLEVIWAGIAVCCYGFAPMRQAMFPLLFILLMIPIPFAAMDIAVTALQKGSADMTAVLFRLTGLPFLRDGFRFALPGIDIEIAEECSGIRSSISLLLCTILAGHLLLRSGWSQVCLALATVPIAMFKNAVRIATISWLGVYVDRGYFFGALHHRAGSVFSIVAIALLLGLLLLLRKLERPRTA